MPIWYWRSKIPWVSKSIGLSFLLIISYIIISYPLLLWLDSLRPVGRFGLVKHLPSALLNLCSDSRLKWTLAQCLSSLALKVLMVGVDMTSCGRQFQVIVALRVRKFSLTILYALCFFRFLSWPLVMLLSNLIFSVSSLYIPVVCLNNSIMSLHTLLYWRLSSFSHRNRVS